MLAVLGWLIMLPVGTVALLCAVQGFRCSSQDRGEQRARSSFIAAFLLAMVTAVIGGASGAVWAVAAMLIGATAAFCAVAGIANDVHQVAPGKRKPQRTVGQSLHDAWLAALVAVLEAWRHLRARKPPADELAARRQRKAPPARTVPGRVVPSRPAGTIPAIPGRRAVPPVRKDPALAGVPLSRAVTDGQVSPAWAAVIGQVADHEPEDDTDFLAHWREQATGFLAYADAMLDQADTVGDEGAGLAAPIVAAIYDGAEVIGDAAHDIAAIRERFFQAYEGSREDVAAGNELPKDGRFITGEDAG